VTDWPTSPPRQPEGVLTEGAKPLRKAGRQLMMSWVNAVQPAVSSKLLARFIPVTARKGWMTTQNRGVAPGETGDRQESLYTRQEGPLPTLAAPE